MKIMIHKTFQFSLGKWIHKDWLEQYSLFSERQINHCHRNCLDNFHGDLHEKIRRDFRSYCQQLPLPLSSFPLTFIFCYCIFNSLLSSQPLKEEQISFLQNCVFAINDGIFYSLFQSTKMYHMQLKYILLFPNF